MSIEIQMLAWAVVLGLVQLMIAATLATQQRGLMWNTGARDGDPAPLRGIAARMDRALRNFLETFPLLAAAVLAVMVTGRANEHSQLGMQLYFWARVAYVPLYASGLPYVRTLAWLVSMVGLVLVLVQLF